MAEQSPQKRQTAKSTQEGRNQVPEKEKKKDLMVNQDGPETAAKRRRHIRARLERKRKLAAASVKPKEAAKKEPVQKQEPVSKQVPKDTDQVPLEPIEDLYPSVQHHTFTGFLPEAEEPHEPGVQVSKEPEIAAEKLVDAIAPEPELKTAPRVVSESLLKLQTPAGAATADTAAYTAAANTAAADTAAGPEPVPVSQPASAPGPRPQFGFAPGPDSTLGPEPAPEFGPTPAAEPGPVSEPESEPKTVPSSDTVQPAAAFSPYEEKEPFPELFPQRESEDMRPKAAENAPSEIIEQEESFEELPSRQLYQQELVHAEEEPGADKEALEEGEKSSAGQSGAQDSGGVPAGGFSAGFFNKLGNVVAFAGAHLRFKYVVLTAIIVFAGFLLAGGFAGNIFRPVYNMVITFFQQKAVQAPVEVRSDGEQLLRAQGGVNSAYVFGKNRGSLGDVTPVSIKNAWYFGKLAEPAVKGETGITASYHYGQHKDFIARNTLFIDYLGNLRELKSLYDTDVYAMLDQTAGRDVKLADYLNKLKAVRVQSSRIIKELGLQIDDLKISFNSLNPDRTNLEQDFFVSLENLAGEKANFLLNSFVDVAQKQTAIKARVSALQQVLDFYEKAVKKLDIRIESIEKNYEVLLRGIRVIEIPGANLDIIIRPK